MDFTARSGLPGYMDSWWTALDDAILGCLPGDGPLGPAELARLLGISQEAAASLLGPAAREAKVRGALVAAAGPTSRPARSAA